MEVTTPENLYKAKYELENLTSEELIDYIRFKMIYIIK